MNISKYFRRQTERNLSSTVLNHRKIGGGSQPFCAWKSQRITVYSYVLLNKIHTLKQFNQRPLK